MFVIIREVSKVGGGTLVELDVRLKRRHSPTNDVQGSYHISILFLLGRYLTY